MECSFDFLIQKNGVILIIYGAKYFSKMQQCLYLSHFSYMHWNAVDVKQGILREFGWERIFCIDWRYILDSNEHLQHMQDLCEQYDYPKYIFRNLIYNPDIYDVPTDDSNSGEAKYEKYRLFETWRTHFFFLIWWHQNWSNSLP